MDINVLQKLVLCEFANRINAQVLEHAHAHARQVFGTHTLGLGSPPMIAAAGSAGHERI